jgi:toxin ParE1/3/4
MSARSPRFVLAPRARRDLRDILKYTERQWGREQRRRYSSQLRAAFAQLAQFPGLGKPRPGFGPEARAYPVEQHLVIYQPSDAEVLILRILHVRRDLDAELA